VQNILILFALILIQYHSQGQNILVKDLDKDSISDTTYIDVANSIIVCRLSSQGFAITQSKYIEMLGYTEIESTKSGFKFNNSAMRGGGSSQFRYDAKAKKIQLIGMSMFGYGPANNDGSGEGSINLLTNDCIGNWKYYDEKKGRLIKIPTIKAKVILNKTFLDDFGDAIFNTFTQKSDALYMQHKALMIKASK
jgi:hypothetical protein